MENNELLQLILNELKDFKQTTNERFNQFEQTTNERFDRIEQTTSERFDRIEKKLDVIAAQTAELTEFKTDASQKLDRLISDVEFVKHKEHLNEEELFKLKTNLQIAK